MICRADLRCASLVAAALTLGAAAPAAGPVAEASAALARGDGIAAEGEAKRALDEGAPRGEVAALIGEAELLQGDLADARRWLADGEFSPATRERGFHALGRLEMAEGDLAAAARAFDKALSTGRGSARLWVDIGRLRYGAGQHYLALDAAKRAVAIDPAEPRALEFQAQLVRDAEGVKAALPLFERALEIAPDDIGLLGEYAATLAEAGRHRDMLRIARRMVERDPRHPRAYFLQAVLAARAGLDDLARRLLARTNGAYGKAPSGMLLAGILELRTGNAGLAVDRFDELARMQPENFEARLLMARALLAHGEANEVVVRFGAAADRADAPSYLLVLVGRAYEQIGRRNDAARYLDRAALAAPSRIGVLAGDANGLSETGAGADVRLIRRLLAQGQAGEALARASVLRQRYPHSIDVEIIAGDVALVADDPAAALAHYSGAARVRRNFALVDRMAMAHRMLGSDDAALDVVSGYLAQNPRSADAAALFGRMLAQRGDWRRASFVLAYASDLRARDPRLLVDAAEARLELGDMAGADEAARRAQRLHRANGAVAAMLARVLQAAPESRGDARLLLAKARRVSESTRLAQR